MNSKLIYWILALGLLALFGITYFETPIDQIFVAETQKLFPVITSVATLFIALSLYDRIGYRKIIYEKKLKAVLDLIEDLQKYQFIVEYQVAPSLEKVKPELLIIRKEGIRKFKKAYHGLLNSPATIMFPAGMNWQQKLFAYTKNPYMPKKITTQLMCFHVDTYPIISNLDGHTLMKMGADEGEKSIGYTYFHDDIPTMETVVKVFEDLLIEIEKWIDSNGGFASDLNI